MASRRNQISNHLTTYMESALCPRKGWLTKFHDSLEEPPVLRVLVAIWALAVVLASAAAAQVPEGIPIGALRWDAWFEGAPDQKVFEQPEWRHRAPFFARWDETGKLHLDGDMEHVLHAEVAYARAIGLDYFVFGFYPDTGSWGRDINFSLKLDRALRSYLNLPDRMGVKFALSLNQLFPQNDIEDIADSFSTFIAHPDYMRTDQGRAPVYILSHFGNDWSKAFGSDDKARKAIETLRLKAHERAAVELIFIIMYYEPEKAFETARRYGLDMASTYSNFAPGQGAVERPFAACARHGEALWQRAMAAKVPYVPNVTLGWDDRPRHAHTVNQGGIVQGSWCGRPDPVTLAAHFEQAAKFAADPNAAFPFRSILIYAWNEWAEGGWMAPNISDGSQRLALLYNAIGRKRRIPPIELAWPDAPVPKECSPRTANKPPSPSCRNDLATGAEWPCPPSMKVKPVTIRAPSGFESLLWPGGWRHKLCY